MFHFFRRGMAGQTWRALWRGLSLVLAYVLLLQSVFIAVVATEHAIAASPELAAICAVHDDGTPTKAPAPLGRNSHCAICIAAASSSGILPDAAAVLEVFSVTESARSLAPQAADLPSPPSPKSAQGPPLTA